MDQLLIALDVDSSSRALELSDRLQSVAGGFKIGSQLFTAHGPSFIRQMSDRGHLILLDLKYHDIPNTVAGAVRAAADMGVWMVTVHASGGHEMMAAAKEAAARDPGGPLIVAVTVLTSFDESALAGLGISRSVPEQVVALASQAQDAGVDGVVASPLEIALIRARCGPEFIIVTPGIRNLETDAINDQARTMDAAGALRAGADYLVVGRPIIAADDPLAAAVQITEGIGQA